MTEVQTTDTGGDAPVQAEEGGCKTTACTGVYLRETRVVELNAAGNEVLVCEAPGSVCVFRSRCGLGEEQDVPASGIPS